MKLFFVNVECEVRNDTRDLPAKEAASKPYRTFVYAVVAPSKREAIRSIPSLSDDNWCELKRYAQNPDGYDALDPVFHGATDHAHKRVL